MKFCILVVVFASITFSPNKASGSVLLSDSTGTKLDTVFVIKKVKVQYGKKDFWIVYESVEDLILLTKNGFTPIKTSKRVVKIKGEKSFGEKLFQDVVSISIKTAIRWVQEEKLGLSLPHLNVPIINH